MSSFGESKAFKYIEDSEKSLDFVKCNCRQISRIYPGAKRQDSSNLKVVPPWNAGCQIVALNYQTEDKQNFINCARFSDNGGCGYILKPDFLRDSSISYSPNSPCGLDTNLYPGHFLAKTLPLKNLHKVYDNTLLLFMAMKKTKIFSCWTKSAAALETAFGGSNHHHLRDVSNLLAFI